jgi:hypothetical protein
MQTQVEEERKQADSYKEQVCDIVIGMWGRVKAIIPHHV